MTTDEGRFTIKGIVQRDSNGWVVQVMPNTSAKKQDMQNRWLEKKEGKVIKLAREEIRHPES